MNPPQPNDLVILSEAARVACDSGRAVEGPLRSG